MRNTQYIAKIESAKSAVEEIKRDKTLPTSRIRLAVNLEVALLEMEVMFRTHFLQANASDDRQLPGHTAQSQNQTPTG